MNQLGNRKKATVRKNIISALSAEQAKIFLISNYASSRIKSNNAWIINMELLLKSQSKLDKKRLYPNKLLLFDGVKIIWIKVN